MVASSSMCYSFYSLPPWCAEPAIPTSFSSEGKIEVTDTLSPLHLIWRLELLPSFIAMHCTLGIPPSIIVFQAARDSIWEESVHFHRAVKKHTKGSLHLVHTTHWNTQLDELSVQSKFQDVVDLEPQSKVWNCIITCLPSSQLFFLCCTGADCLPTPLNLRRWRFQSDLSCRLCGSSSPTTFHILSCCPGSIELREVDVEA